MCLHAGLEYLYFSQKPPSHNSIFGWLSVTICRMLKLHTARSLFLSCCLKIEFYSLDIFTDISDICISNWITLHVCSARFIGRFIYLPVFMDLQALGTYEASFVLEMHRCKEIDVYRTNRKEYHRLWERENKMKDIFACACTEMFVCFIKMGIFLFTRSW